MSIFNLESVLAVEIAKPVESATVAIATPSNKRVSQIPAFRSEWNRRQAFALTQEAKAIELELSSRKATLIRTSGREQVFTVKINVTRANRNQPDILEAGCYENAPITFVVANDAVYRVSGMGRTAPYIINADNKAYKLSIVKPTKDLLANILIAQKGDVVAQMQGKDYLSLHTQVSNRVNFTLRDYLQNVINQNAQALGKAQDLRAKANDHMALVDDTQFILSEVYENIFSRATNAKDFGTSPSLDHALAENAKYWVMPDDLTIALQNIVVDQPQPKPTK